jgi:hypothetical protein
LINGAFFEALKNLLEQVVSSDGFDSPYQRDKAAEDLAARWLVDDEAKAEVATLLRNFALDEASIEAAAYRLRAKEIEALDLMITWKQKSLQDALRFIGKLRKNLGERLRQSSAELLEADQPPTLVATAS